VRGSARLELVDLVVIEIVSQEIERERIGR
jgi:hypothetical protein